MARVLLVLGRHEYGTSDPAMWADELVAAVRSPVHMFESETFAAAVPMLLEKGEHSRAMWAARLSVACEDAAKGDLLTTTVLEAKAAATAAK
ncbi:MAG TPA: hypothetical protein VE988_04450 [Gemmataceae bacterium]|nr:hypothetical protein [Gemmataceae bacterium]